MVFISLSGVPPFSDETPDAVFKNILDLNLEFPEGDESLSCEAVTAVMSLLTLNPVQRPKLDALKRMVFFDKVRTRTYGSR